MSKPSAPGRPAGRMPAPAHPHERAQPLPGQQPKPIEDDPQSGGTLQRILAKRAPK